MQLVRGFVILFVWRVYLLSLEWRRRFCVGGRRSDSHNWKFLVITSLIHLAQPSIYFGTLLGTCVVYLKKNSGFKENLS